MYFEDEIFEDIAEDVAKETVSVEPDEGRGWKHYIGFTDGGFLYFENYEYLMKELSVVKRAFEMLGIKCSEIGYIPKLIADDAFDDYYIEPLNEDASTNAKEKKGFIAFCFDKNIRFSPGYHIAHALTLRVLNTDSIHLSIDSHAFDSFYRTTMEKYKETHKNICVRICEINAEEYDKKYADMFRLERSFRRYNINFIRKIANSRFSSEYKFLDCFDVFDDCTIKDRYYGDAIFADLWVADLKMMLGLETQFDARDFAPIMINADLRFSNDKIVRSEVVYSQSNILVIIELETSCDNSGITTSWISFTASSYEMLTNRLKIILSSENDAAIIAEIISDEMYYATNNQNFRTR